MLTSSSIHGLVREEGQSFWFLGSLMILKASSETTKGVFSLIEQVAPAGFAPPLHVHHAEDEVFNVLEGDITFFVGAQTLYAPAGTYVYLPRDIPHSFRVEGATAARLLQWTYPAGVEQFFVDLGVPTQELILPPPASPEMVQKAIQSLLERAPTYHIEIVGPPPSADHH
ncbi:MAG: cupin domain-containing protein [Chloroflexales bacterium]